MVVVVEEEGASEGGERGVEGVVLEVSG